MCSVSSIAALLGVALVLAPCIESPRAEAVPAPTRLDQRVRTAQYDAGQVYRLWAQVGYHIELEFEPGESLVGQAAGDLEGVTLAALDNRVFLKPKAADVHTNLTITTNRRQYRFDYVVQPQAEEADLRGALYLVRFIYPPAPSQKQPSAGELLEKALDEIGTPRPRNVDYWYGGHAALRPTAASDDGVHTRLTFDVHAELPAIFVRNDDGSESLLNFSVDDGDVIVHRVARRLIVRRGRLTGCIVNQGYLGSGEQLKSGTVTPGVERVLKERVP
jgi:type IV secretion system protein VirB9